MQCSKDLFGPFDMVGIECTSSETCLYGASCDMVTKRCVHTEEHVIACLLERIDPLITQSLLNIWRIPEKVSEERMTKELRERFLKNICTGPGSLAFR